MTIRSVPAPGAVALAVLPVGHGETVGRLNGSMRIVSLPEANNQASYISPFGFLEWNYAIFGVPWRIAATYSHNIDASPEVPGSQADWDAFCKRLILTYQGTSNDYYGANPDDTENLDMRAPAGKELGDKTDGTKDSEPLIEQAEMGLGPQGLVRFMSDERWLMSGTRSTIGANVNSPSYSSSDNLDDVNFLDSIDLNATINWSGPGFVVLCAYRYKVDATPGFAASYGPNENIPVSGSPPTPVALADKRRIFGAYYNGDYHRLRKIIADPASDIGSYMRTLLFSGDVNINSLNSTNNPLVSTLFNDNNAVRSNDLLIGVKLAAPMQTPYTVDPAFLG